MRPHVQNRLEQAAADESSVRSLYQDTAVAESYIDKRFSHSWSRLLHDRQVEAVNHVLETYKPDRVLEVAPGPARLATALRGVRRGIMVEYSEEMLDVARTRLQAAGLSDVWEVRRGNAFDLGSSPVPCDFLYTFRFIRHFQADERVRLYQGFRKCLAAGGLLMFDVVNTVIRQRLDAREPERPAGDLPVYDVTYAPEEFRTEMNTQGFEVVRMIPIVTHMASQSWISCTLDPRLPQMSRLLVRLLERLPSANPLEWIAVCRKTA